MFLDLVGYAPRRVMGTRMTRILRIKTDFLWPDGHSFLIFYGLNPASGGQIQRRQR